MNWFHSSVNNENTNLALETRQINSNIMIENIMIGMYDNHASIWLSLSVFAGLDMHLFPTSLQGDHAIGLLENGPFYMFLCIGLLYTFM